jgi:hypothetical protein
LKKLKKQYLQEKTGSATTESEMRNILGAKMALWLWLEAKD